MDWGLIIASLLGGLNVWQLYINWKTRKSQTKVAEADALERMTGVYDKFVADMERKYDELRREGEKLKAEASELRSEAQKLRIESDKLRKEIKGWEEKCKHCKVTNNEKGV